MNTFAKHQTGRRTAARITTSGAGVVFRLRPVAVALCLSGLPFADALAQDYFNPSFLDDGSGNQVDLSAYEKAGAVPEGSYLVDVYMNSRMIFTRQIAFGKSDSGDARPELTVGMLKKMGVATNRLAAMKGWPDDHAVDLKTDIPGATVSFSLTKLRLDLTVPQVDMLEQVDGTIDPSLWDEGMPGMMFNYMLSGSRNDMDGQYGSGGSHSSSLFSTVNGGANLGAWRLRSSWSYNSTTTSGDSYNSSQSQSQFMNTNVQRDVQSLKGELLMGESSTGNDIFDSVPFRGVQLTSNDDMLPSSQRTFSPVVTGIANSTAKVSVRQDGNLVYETTVPPGPFRLTDIYNAGSGGTLEVTVTEADGTTHVSTQNFGTLSVMKRPGNVDYEVTAGRYHGSTSVYQGSSDPLFALATATVGLPYNLTLYGGILTAEKYLSGALGVATSLGILGAVSIDTTLAQAKVSTEGVDADGNGNGRYTDSTENGAAWRMRYSKSIDATGTSLDISGTRYSSSHFLSFQNAATYGYGLQRNQAPWLAESPRSSLQVNLSQTLGWLGSVYLNASRNNYYNSDRVVNSTGAGFSSSIKGVSYSVNYNEDHTQNDDGGWPTNRQVSLNVAVPFSIFNPDWAAVRNIYANYSMSHDNQGRTSQQTGLSGNLLDNKLSWSASESHDNQGGGNSGNLSLGWQADRGSFNGNYGFSQNTTTWGGSATGAMVIHPHGVAFTNMLGDSMAVVEAPGAEGVKVTSGGSATTDSRGYAVVPYLQSYQRNNINLDATSLPDGVDLAETSTAVYPTRGAIVAAKFKTRVGRQAMLTLHVSGKPVPFGAIVMMPGDDAQSGAIVGDDGVVYLTGAPQSGELSVQWGTTADKQCRVKFDLGPLPETKDSSGKPTVNIAQQTLECVPSASAAPSPEIAPAIPLPVMPAPPVKATPATRAPQKATTAPDAGEQNNPQDTLPQGPFSLPLQMIPESVETVDPEDVDLRTLSPARTTARR